MRCQGTGHIPLRLNGRGASVERFSQDTLLHALKNKNPILFFLFFIGGVLWTGQGIHSGTIHTHAGFERVKGFVPLNTSNATHAQKGTVCEAFFFVAL